MFKIISAIVVLITCIFACIYVSAATKAYELDMELKLDGETVSSPKVVTIAGEKASITQDIDDLKGIQVFIEITSREGEMMGNEGILLDMVVAKIVNGEKHILSTPKILTKNGRVASIHQDGTLESPRLDLKVIAKEKSL